MEVSDVANMIGQQIKQKYGTGIAWIECANDFSTLDVDWVDGGSTQIEITVRNMTAGSSRWTQADR